MIPQQLQCYGNVECSKQHEIATYCNKFYTSGTQPYMNCVNSNGKSFCNSG